MLSKRQFTNALRNGWLVRILGVMALGAVSLGEGWAQVPPAAFQAATSYLLDGIATSAAVGDFNGDGNTDLAVTSEHNVSILLGNGNGTFQPPVTYIACCGPFRWRWATLTAMARPIWRSPTTAVTT